MVLLLWTKLLLRACARLEGLIMAPDVLRILLVEEGVIEVDVLNLEVEVRLLPLIWALLEL